MTERVQVKFLAKSPVPVTRYGACVWCFLAQVSGSDVVHVVKLHVLAAHCPDKRIKLLEENIGKTLSDINHSRIL